jgi:hypothetical protein
MLKKWGLDDCNAGMRLACRTLYREPPLARRTRLSAPSPVPYLLVRPAESGAFFYRICRPTKKPRRDAGRTALKIPVCRAR